MTEYKHQKHGGKATPSARCTSTHPHPLPATRELRVNSTDAGTCGCDAQGVVRCLPGAIIIGIEKGSTAELKVSPAACPARVRRVRDSGFQQNQRLVESSRASPLRRPREDGLTHPV